MSPPSPPPVPACYQMPGVVGTILGQLGHLMLHRRCTCPQGAASCTPVWRLVERYGGALSLADILPRLVCAQCRRPATVILSDSPHIAFQGGPPPGWSVVLATPEAPHGVFAPNVERARRS